MMVLVVRGTVKVQEAPQDPKKISPQLLDANTIVDPMVPQYGHHYKAPSKEGRIVQEPLEEDKDPY